MHETSLADRDQQDLICMSLGPGKGATISSLQRQKPPVAYTGVIRKVGNRVRQLQDEIAAECATNMEFEDASRRSFEYLGSQMRNLKKAFQTLTDTLLEELEGLSSNVRRELWQVEQRQGELERQLHDRHGDLEKSILENRGALGDATSRQDRRIEQLAQDIDK